MTGSPGEHRRWRSAGGAGGGARRGVGGGAGAGGGGRRRQGRWAAAEVRWAAAGAASSSWWSCPTWAAPCRGDAVTPGADTTSPGADTTSTADAGDQRQDDQPAERGAASGPSWRLGVAALIRFGVRTRGPFMIGRRRRGLQWSPCSSDRSGRPTRPARRSPRPARRRTAARPGSPATRSANPLGCAP